MTRTTTSAGRSNARTKLQSTLGRVLLGAGTFLLTIGLSSQMMLVTVGDPTAAERIVPELLADPGVQDVLADLTAGAVTHAVPSTTSGVPAEVADLLSGLDPDTLAKLLENAPDGVAPLVPGEPPVAPVTSATIRDGVRTVLDDRGIQRDLSQQVATIWSAALTGAPLPASVSFAAVSAELTRSRLVPSDVIAAAVTVSLPDIPVPAQLSQLSQARNVALTARLALVPGIVLVAVAFALPGERSRRVARVGRRLTLLAGGWVFSAHVPVYFVSRRDPNLSRLATIIRDGLWPAAVPLTVSVGVAGAALWLLAGATSRRTSEA